MLGEWGIPEDSPEGRPRLERALEERPGAEEGEEFKPIRRGWYLGEETFREELLERGQFLILIHKAAEATVQSWPAS